MKIYHNQLPLTLKKNDPKVWLVFGDEPWQKMDSLATIKNHAQQRGFTETLRFATDNKFDWQLVIDEMQSMSLFSTQRIIEIEFTTNKIGDNGNKALLAISEMLYDDVLLLFHGPKVDGPTANRKWFKALSQQGCYLPLYDIDNKGLFQWLQKQSRQLNVNLTPELSSLLVELFEGNLLALDQELQKLSLLFGTQQITLADAEDLVIKQAKFNPFQIVDALLMGNCAKCVTMLDQLQQEGTPPVKIIWAFHKEIQQLYAMLNLIEQGQSIQNIYKQYRIWDKRKPLYQHALKNISLSNVKIAMQRLASIDLLSKSNAEFNSFILLADFCSTLYYGEVTKLFSLDYQFS